MEGLGRLFNVAVGAVPVDLSTAAVTGKRVALKSTQSLTIVFFKAAGTAGDDPAVTLQQHTAASGGTSANLSIIDHYYLKNAATLAGTETWTKVTQSIGATITDPGGAGTSAESQQLVAIEVNGTKLTDGYGWVSLNVADVGTNAQLGAVLYILHDLYVQRAPDALAATL